MDLLNILFDTRIVGLILAICIPILFYWYSTRTFDYWKKRGIRYVKPYPLIGSLLDTFTKNFEDIEVDRYYKYGRLYGLFEGMKPMIVISEPEHIKNILVKDFQYFSTRRVFDSGEPLVDNMLSLLRGEDWKRVRTIISPTFSTGKIKRLMSIFNDSSKSLISNCNERISGPIDMRKVYDAFSIDVIASSAFSTKIDTHKDPENDFVKHAKQVFSQRLGPALILFIFMPRVMKYFNVNLFNLEHVNFFKNVTLEIIKERKRTGQKRNDFLQLVMDAAEGLPKEDTLEDKSDNILSNYGEESANKEVFKTAISKHLSMDELVANCIIFFIAGYHTTATTLGWATYLLALNPDVQDKFFKEIKEVLRETNGELTYEAVQKMKYLDNIISESLRIYSPAIRHDRTAEADYELGDTGITIPKGMVVGIPAFAMHRDPHFFPEPMKFNPDRFNLEERDKQIPYSYLPFGAGPRNCVGMRFALVQIKVCLVNVFSQFHVKTCPETQIPQEFGQASGQASGVFQLKVIDLRLERRSDCPLKM